jgi:hypothetical protein
VKILISQKASKDQESVSKLSLYYDANHPNNLVPKFNNMFELIVASRFVNDCEPNFHVGVNGQFNANAILAIAEQKYASMMEAHKWNVLSKNGSKSTVITVGSGKSPVCWNCGGAHKLPDCTLPKNQEKYF